MPSPLPVRSARSGAAFFLSHIAIFKLYFAFLANFAAFAYYIFHV